jgi:hypothetical protein
MEPRKIRISPSGPFLQNDEGGFAVPGPGFQLRLAEKKATCGGSITFVASELGSEALRVTLPDCSPDLNYKASAQINTWEQTNGSPVTLTFSIQRSVDAGATWTTVKSDVFLANASDQSMMAVVNAELALGSAAWGLTTPGQEVIVRAIVKTGVDGDVATMPTFQGFISFAELL